MMQNFSRVALLSIRNPVTVRAAAFAAPTKKTSEKSLGDEKNYVNKQEQLLLKNLLKKVTEQAKASTLTEEQKAEAAEKDLRELVTKAGVTQKLNDSFFKDVLKWKADK